MIPRSELAAPQKSSYLMSVLVFIKKTISSIYVTRSLNTMLAVGDNVPRSGCLEEKRLFNLKQWCTISETDKMDI